MNRRSALESRGSLVLLIGSMGFLGACCRFLIEFAFPAVGGMPLATLLINVVGCFVMEIVNLFIVRRTHAPRSVGRALGIGFVGAFTTLSAFSSETLALLHAGDHVAALVYVSLTFWLTILAALAGRGVVVLADRHRLARLREQRRRQHEGRGRR